MANYGFKSVQQGKNINSSDPRDFIFNSKYGSVKVVQETPKKVPLSISINGSATVTVTIPHNLGFIPLCMVFYEPDPGSNIWYNGTAIAGTTQDVYLYARGGGTLADKNNLYLVFNNGTGSTQVVRYYYYIFGDSAI